jgi:TPR repeat protein
MNRRHVLPACIVLAIAFAAALGWQFRARQQGTASDGQRDQANMPTSEAAATEAPTVKSAVRKRPFLQRDPPALPPSDAPLASRLSSLEDAAKNGDPDTGYALALELRECLGLDDRYDKLQSDVRTNRKPPEALKAIADALDEKSEHCKGISPDDLKNYGQWMELAARRGSIAAQLGYPAFFGELLPQHALETEWIEDYKTNSLQFLSAAANEGSIDALSQLASTYQDGLLAPKDAIKAYSYEYAISQTGQVTSATKVLDLWGKELTPQQIEAARQQGNNIYKNCCM